MSQIRFLFDKTIQKFHLSNFEDLIKHSFWSIFGSVLSRGVMLISSILLARFLSQSEYGELGIVRSTINMFVIVAGFSIGNTTSRYISLHKKDNISEARRIFDVSFLFMLVSAFFISLAVFVFAAPLASLSFGDSNLAGEIRISASLLFFTTINGAYSGSLAGFQDFKTIAKNTFISSLIQAILAIIGGVFFGVSGCLVGYGIGYFVLFILHKRAVHKKFSGTERIIGIKDFFNTDKTFLWSFSLPSVISSLMVTPVFWWCKAFMIRSSSFKEMALFDVADQWRIIVLFIPSALIQIALPALTSNQENFRDTLNFNLKMNLAASVLIIVPLILFSETILGFYGGEYINQELFIVLVCSAIFTSFCSVIGSAIASLGMMWKGFLFNFLWAIYLIFFTIIFLRLGYGALGLAYAFLLSYCLHGIGQFVFLKMQLKEKIL